MRGRKPSNQAANAETPLALIVDDEEAIAETLADFLSELGYKTLMAANGEEALALTRQRWPALVFTDLMMPHMNGVELIAALRAEAADRKIKPPFIVLLTAASRRAAERTGADAVILKPFELEQIEQIVDGVAR
ncbi:MAG TPA: response regulator [Ktedonobacterales bacterium]|jgi:CheY-like chemotaxis protein